MINNQFNNQNSIDRDRVHQYVQENLRKRQRIINWCLFGIHAMIFVIFVAAAWVTTFGGERSQYNPMVNPRVINFLFLMTSGWALGLVFHFLANVLDTKMLTRELMQRLATEAVNQQMFSNLFDEPEKQKRKRN
jgi:hypothetical protein